MRAAARASSSRDHRAISESEEEPGHTEADADEFRNHDETRCPQSRQPC